MAKVYEALRRAEEERKRKVAGDVGGPVPAVDWDPTPETAPRRKKRFSLKRTFRRGKEAPAYGGATEANRRRIALLEPESFIAEQFRMLRGRLDSIGADSPLRTVAIASANAGDGKSNVAINLAIVSSMSVGRNTLLVDCDMRRPTIHRSLGLEPEVGIAEILLERASVDDAILKLEGTNLDVIGVRLQPENPSELLASAHMRAVVSALSQRYDRVIFDTPAALGLPDAKIISELCDGYLMVVRAGQTAREDVEAALDVLDRRHVLGLVLNGAEMGHERYAYY